MKKLTVIARGDCLTAFAQWEASPAFAAAERHQFYSRTGRHFYAETYDQDTDTSFAVVRGDDPLMIVFCNMHGDTLGLFGEPIHLIPHAHLDPAGHGAVVAAAMKAIDAIAMAQNASDVVMREDIAGPALTALGRACVTRGGSVQVVQHGFCDLSWDEKDIHRNVRKSYQSLINKGRREMRMAYINAENADLSLFYKYREFHALMAGRVTRSDRSWQAMFDWIASGGGELALAYLNDDELVAGTMTTDGSEVAYYASGVYDRTKFDKPLAHFPLYDAILRSRGRNMKLFDLGILKPRGVGSEKEYNIGQFKRGFATLVDMHFVWRWTIRDVP